MEHGVVLRAQGTGADQASRRLVPGQHWEPSGWWVGCFFDLSLRTGHLATRHPDVPRTVWWPQVQNANTQHIPAASVPAGLHASPAILPCACTCWDCCWPGSVPTPRPPRLAQPLPWPGNQTACTTSWPNYIKTLAPFCHCSLTYLPPQPL